MQLNEGLLDRNDSDNEFGISDGTDYLKFENYTITKSLKGKLKHFPRKEQRKMAFVQNMVLFCIRRNRLNPSYFVNVSGTTFNRKVKDYRRIITELKAIREIDENPAYQVGKFSKSYRIPKESFDSGFITFSPKKSQVRKTDDKTALVSKSISHQQRCFQDLTARLLFISTGDAIQDGIALRELNNVRGGAANIVKGQKVRREYNTLLMIPKAARGNVVRKDGKELFDFDIRSAHPFLLLAFLQGKVKEEYASFITNADTDIYAHVKEFSKSVAKRETLKLELCRFLNGGKSKKFDRFYSEKFPEIHALIVKGGKDNAALLQNLEADIMNQVGEFAADNNLWYFQAHDGFISTEQDGDRISEYLKEVVFGRIGFSPLINQKRLG